MDDSMHFLRRQQLTNGTESQITCKNHPPSKVQGWEGCRSELVTRRLGPVAEKLYLTLAAPPLRTAAPAS